MRGVSLQAGARFILCLLVALLALGSQPGLAIPDPTTGPPRKPALPVQVQFTEITPTLMQGDNPLADDLLTVSATLKNTGDREITSVWVRLQRDRRIDSRAGLLAVDQKQPAYSSVVGKDTPLNITLSPGETETVQVSVPRGELAIYDSGAYPILLNVQGQMGGQEGRVGQAAFTLPRMATPTAPLSVAWVLPLIDRPHTTATPGLFRDDALADQIADGGRLDLILKAAEEFGGAAKLTLFIDPALVDEIVTMSGGYQVERKNGAPKDGVGKAAAADFLDRLKSVAETTPIAITPYADVDVVALNRAGLGSIVTEARALGEDVVAETLNIAPITDIAWPADGIITDAALNALHSDGVSTVVLGGASFGQEDYLASADEITEDAATVLPEVTAIAADPALGRLLTDGSQYAAGPVAAVERIAAELSVIAQQAPERPRNVVLVPPRTWHPSAALLERVLSMTTTSPWLTPVSLTDVSVQPPVDRGALEYPASLSTRELPVAALGELLTSYTQINELAPAFGDEEQQNIVLGAAKKSIYTASSSAWRGDSKAVLSGAQEASDALEAIRGQIRLVTPNNGSYTLAASDAPLVFTVENNLSVPVHFRIGLDPRRSAGLSPTDIGVQTIPARSRATVKLPTTVKRSGTFSVVAQISTPDGKPLGKDVQIKVSSSAYGTVALVVTGAALALLLALIARRWWKRRLFQQAEARERAEQERAEQNDVVNDGQTVGSHPTRADTDPERNPPHTEEEPR